METVKDIDAEFEEKASGTALVQQPQATSLFHTDDPVEVIERATRVANALYAVIEAKKLYTIIQGKKYVQVEGWQTVGAMLNLTTICEETRPIEGGWEAVVVVRDMRGQIIGRAENQCTTAERSKRSWEEYAIRSMAQTRATSKALRSILAWIMVLAGYQATPAEEMPRDAEPGKIAEKAPSGGQVYQMAVAAGLCMDGVSFCAWARENVLSCDGIAPGGRLTPQQCKDIADAIKAAAA